jgi:hypothetical protein
MKRNVKLLNISVLKTKELTFENQQKYLMMCEQPARNAAIPMIEPEL